MNTSLRFDSRRWNRRLDTTALVLSVLVIVVFSSLAADKTPHVGPGFLACRTSYLGNDLATRKDQKWSEQDYTVLGVQTRPAPGRTDEVEVRFRLQFAASNGCCFARSTTDNVFQMEIALERQRLVALHEPGVPDQKA